MHSAQQHLVIVYPHFIRGKGCVLHAPLCTLETGLGHTVVPRGAPGSTLATSRVRTHFLPNSGIISPTVFQLRLRL